MTLRPASPAAVSEAVGALREGRLIGLPTETVYGLAADAANARAVAGIFAAKGRPRFNPLICHVTGSDMAADLVEMPAAAQALIRRFWPGPLTLVLPRRAGAPVADLVCAGLPTLAVRAPDHPVAQAVLDAFGGALAAPSANPSGKLSPTTAADVEERLGAALAMVLDGGPCRVGLESSIVGVEPERLVLLRPGFVTAEALAKAAGLPIAARASAAPLTAPGQLPSHYAPDAPVRLNATEAGPEECLIGFGPVHGDFTLSDSGDLIEAAANLFQTLRAADRTGKAIAVAPIPHQGLGLAINDRLARAAAPRGDSENRLS